MRGTLPLVLPLLLLIAGCTRNLQDGQSSTEYNLGELPAASVEDYALVPDGNTIIASYYGDDQQARLVSINLSTGAANTLMDWPGVHLRSPSFSADGSRLAFVATEFGNFQPIGVQHRFFVMDMASGDSRQIGETGYWVQAASISPSGENVFLIIGTERGFETPWLDPVNQADIYQVPAQGGPLKHITNLELHTIRDLAVRSDQVVIVSVNHLPRGAGERYEGMYAADTSDGRLERIPLILQRSQNYAPHGMCVTAGGEVLTIGQHPITIFDFRNDTFRDLGSEWMQEPCLDERSGSIYFVCQEESWGPKQIMRLDESGQRRRVFPPGPLVPQCVS